MTILRLGTSLILMVAAMATAALTDPQWLVGITFLGFVLRRMLWRNTVAALHSTLPILMFAGVLALMQWISSTPVSLLPLKTVAIFLLTTAAFRVTPWSELTPTIHRSSSHAALVLFAFFVRHFFVIFTTENGRVFRARALCISRAHGSGSFRSLVAALGAVFSRSVNRAEHFYAAQVLRGLAQ